MFKKFSIFVEGKEGKCECKCAACKKPVSDCKNCECKNCKCKNCKCN